MRARTLCATGLAALFFAFEACQPSSTIQQGSVDRITVPSGTVLVVLLDLPLSTEANLVGDGFQATLAEPLVVQGQPVFPGGTLVLGMLTSVRKPGDEQPAEITLALTGIESPSGDHYALETSPLELIAESKGLKGLKRVAVTSVNATQETPGPGELQSGLGSPPTSEGGTVVGVSTDDSHVRLGSGQKLQFSLSESTELPHPQGRKEASS